MAGEKGYPSLRLRGYHYSPIEGAEPLALLSDLPAKFCLVATRQTLDSLLLCQTLEIPRYGLKAPGQILLLMDLEGIEWRKPLRLQVAEEADKIKCAISRGEMLIHGTVIVVQVHLY